MRVGEDVYSIHVKKLPQMFQTFVMGQLISTKGKNSTMARNIYSDVSYHFVSLKDLSQPCYGLPVAFAKYGIWNM